MGTDLVVFKGFFLRLEEIHRNPTHLIPLKPLWHIIWCENLYHGSHFSGRLQHDWTQQISETLWRLEIPPQIPSTFPMAGFKHYFGPAAWYHRDLRRLVAPSIIEGEKTMEQQVVLRLVSQIEHKSIKEQRMNFCRWSSWKLFTAIFACTRWSNDTVKFHQDKVFRQKFTTISSSIPDFQPQIQIPGTQIPPKKHGPLIPLKITCQETFLKHLKLKTHPFFCSQFFFVQETLGCILVPQAKLPCGRPCFDAIPFIPKYWSLRTGGVCLVAPQHRDS